MKGISPLIAAVLLIAFTVSIATIVIGWFTTFVRTTTSNVTESTSETMGCSVASISIEHVYCNSTAETCKIIVKNTGFKDFTTVNALISRNDGARCTGSLTEGLNKGEVKTITLSACPTMSATTFDLASVTTECGGVGDSTTDSSLVDFVS